MFSKSGGYAIRAVLFLAAYSTSEKKIGISEIAEALNVPRHFLAKILQQLSKQKLISSLKGPSGGFYLTEKELNGSLKSIIECIDKLDFMNSCMLGLPECSSEAPCPIHENVEVYRKGLLNLINDHTINEIAFRVKEGKIRI